ncbi:MAG: hypothetical protein FJZ87_13065 [Chloroflexi bacterium]|nr:hypothetical protein [Chloroflexota bacterium]
MGQIDVGDRVEIFLDSRKFKWEGWYPGVVFRIDPYSNHRRFYWVRLDEDSRALLGIREISIFNPKFIRKSV